MSMKSRNILLFGSADDAGLEMCRSLGRAGHRVTILRFAAQRTLADHSRYCAESLYLGSPYCGASSYMARFLDVLRARQFEYLFPVDDLAWELTYTDYQAISALTRVVGPSPASYAIVRNQYEALKVAESAGLACPTTILVKCGEPIAVPSFPWIVKPAVACAIIDDEPQRFSTREVHTADELDAKLRDDLPRIDVLLQSLPGGGSLSIGFCAVDGEVLGACVINHLHEFVGTGRSSYRRVEAASQEILALAQGVARQLRWTGFLTIKCSGSESEDKLFATEMICNPWSSISLSALGQVDFPRLLIETLEGKRDQHVLIPNRMIYTRNLHTDIRWLLAELKQSARSKVIMNWAGSFGHMLLGKERLDIEQLDDPSPAIRQFDMYAKRLLERLSVRSALARRYATTRPLSAESLNRTASILFVCKGNINRSIVAEQLLRARGFTHVRSAGLLGVSGRRPSKQAEDFLTNRLGIDLGHLRSQSLTRALSTMPDVDMVLCFEGKHVELVLERFPSLRGRVLLVTKLERNGNGRPDINDPHGAPAPKYFACFQRIERIVDHVAAEVDEGAQ
jgi:protein-tyrosine-phosphatase/predicted ATP-grasp superfamily ATP-dependent carboligase